MKIYRIIILIILILFVLYCLYIDSEYDNLEHLGSTPQSYTPVNSKLVFTGNNKSDIQNSTFEINFNNYDNTNLTLNITGECDYASITRNTPILNLFISNVSISIDLAQPYINYSNPKYYVLSVNKTPQPVTFNTLTLDNISFTVNGNLTVGNNVYIFNPILFNNDYLEKNDINMTPPDASKDCTNGVLLEGVCIPISSTDRTGKVIETPDKIRLGDENAEEDAINKEIAESEAEATKTAINEQAAADAAAEKAAADVASLKAKTDAAAAKAAADAAAAKAAADAAAAKAAADAAAAKAAADAVAAKAAADAAAAKTAADAAAAKAATDAVAAKAAANAAAAKVAAADAALANATAAAKESETVKTLADAAAAQKASDDAKIAKTIADAAAAKTAADTAAAKAAADAAAAKAAADAAAATKAAAAVTAARELSDAAARAAADALAAKIRTESAAAKAEAARAAADVEAAKRAAAAAKRAAAVKAANELALRKVEIKPTNPRAAPTIALPPADTKSNRIKIAFKLNTDYPALQSDASNIISKIETELLTELRLSKDRIQYISIYPGSIIVNLYIYPETNQNLSLYPNNDKTPRSLIIVLRTLLAISGFPSWPTLKDMDVEYGIQIVRDLEQDMPFSFIIPKKESIIDMLVRTGASFALSTLVTNSLITPAGVTTTTHKMYLNVSLTSNYTPCNSSNGMINFNETLTKGSVFKVSEVPILIDYNLEPYKYIDFNRIVYDNISKQSDIESMFYNLSLVYNGYSLSYCQKDCDIDDKSNANGMCAQEKRIDNSLSQKVEYGKIDNYGLKNLIKFKIESDDSVTPYFVSMNPDERIYFITNKFSTNIYPNDYKKIVQVPVYSNNAEYYTMPVATTNLKTQQTIYSTTNVPITGLRNDYTPNKINDWQNNISFPVVDTLVSQNDAYMQYAYNFKIEIILPSDYTNLPLF
jgi:hypothetical protein